MNQKLTKIIRNALLALLVFFIFGIGSQVLFESTWFTSSIAYILNKNNFHEIVPSKVYRSGELRNDKLIENIKKYNIKTIIDLRKGSDHNKRTELREENIAKNLGISYQWIPMVGSNTKQHKAIEKLISLSESIEEPILIHCSSGTHRSGVITAIWLMIKEEVSPEKAAEQLSPKFGFFLWERNFKSLIQGHKTLDWIIWDYIKDYKSTKMDFKSWFYSKNNYKKYGDTLLS